MFGVFRFSSSSKAATAVVRSNPADVMEALMREGATPQNLIDLAALSFTNTNEMRIFALELAPQLSSEQLHEINDFLTRDQLGKVGKDVVAFCNSETLAKSLLTYEAVHHREHVVEHVKSGGAIYSSLSFLQIGALMTGAIDIPPTMLEFGHMLFNQVKVDYSSRPDDAASLRSDREEISEHTALLNAVDRFIMKYIMAELDETRKEQQDRLMEDGREDLSAYRGGRKKAVGLSVRQAIVMEADIPQAFHQALQDNNISYEAFFEGGTRKYLPEPLFSILEGARPSVAFGATA